MEYAADQPTAADYAFAAAQTANQNAYKAAQAGATLADQIRDLQTTVTALQKRVEYLESLVSLPNFL